MTTLIRWALLLGAIAMAYFAGRISGTLDRADSWLTAIATAMLTLIAGIQLTREISDRVQGSAAARQKLLPHAWLARRNCLSAVQEATTHGGWEWLRRTVTGFDIVESRLITVVTLAAEVGPAEATDARNALRAFMAAADIVLEALDPAKGFQPPQKDDARDRASAMYADAAKELAKLTASLDIEAGGRSAVSPGA